MASLDISAMMKYRRILVVEDDFLIASQFARALTNFGAEIVGLDLSRPINDQDFARIHRTHLDHHVVVFRDQRITPEQQIAFSRRFGVLQIHVLCPMGRGTRTDVEGFSCRPR